MVVMDAEQAEVVPDEVEHRGDGARRGRYPASRFRRVGVPVAEFRGERGSHRHEIVARIEALRDLADLLAERLAVTHVQRAGEDVSTCAPASLT